MIINDFVTTGEPLPPRTIIYGSASIGKTTFASAALSQVFNLVEAGQGKQLFKSISLSHNIKTRREDVY